MGYFLTGKSRIEQTEKDGYWKLTDNELYMHSDGRISIVPRYFWTDGYTFPSFLMMLTGDKNKLDVRPSHAHDLNCRFHERLYVNLTVKELKIRRLLREHNGKMICEDIPNKYLSIEEVSKTNADDMLKEMMLVVGIDKLTCNLVRFGVRFNLNWYLRTGFKSLNQYKIFEEDIGLVRGV